MEGKKKVDSPAAAAPSAPAASPAPAAAPAAAPVAPAKAPKMKKPAGPSTPLTLGDIAVISSCVLLVAALVFEMLALKVLQLF